MLAIDIETVPADPDADGSNPDFLDSREFGLLGIGLGVRSRETDGREVEVLFHEYQCRHSSWASLKDALDVTDPVSWDGENVTNSRITQLGADYLCDRAGLSSDVPVDALEKTLPEYTVFRRGRTDRTEVIR